MQRQWTPLLGVVFVVLVVLRLFVTGAGVPDASASGEEVLSYYEENELREVTASLTAVAAAAVLVFFAVHLRRVLRAAAPDDYLPDAVFAGGILVAAALGLAEGLHGALAVDPEYLTPESAKALHVLDQQLIFPTMLGFGVLLLARAGDRAPARAPDVARLGRAGARRRLLHARRALRDRARPRLARRAVGRALPKGPRSRRGDVAGPVNRGSEEGDACRSHEGMLQVRLLALSELPTQRAAGLHLLVAAPDAPSEPRQAETDEKDRGDDDHERIHAPTL